MVIPRLQQNFGVRRPIDQAAYQRYPGNAGLVRAFRHRHRTLTMRPILCALLVLARAAVGQTSSPVSDALRESFAATAPRIQLAAEAMPADRYAERMSAAETSYGETVAILANYSGLYCQRLTGMRDPVPASDEVLRRDSVVAHLKAKLAYCRAALAAFTDVALADTVQLGGPKTKAAAVHELLTMWAVRYEYLIALLRRHGVVPPVP